MGKRRSGVIVATALLGLVMLAAMQGRAAAGLVPPKQPDRYVYVVDGGTGSPQLERRVARSDTRLGRFAPLGHFGVVPRGQNFTISVDDFGTLDGFELPVQVYSRGERLFRGCVPVRTQFAITGASSGEPAWVFMGYEQLGFGCNSRATAGFVTIRGASSEADTTH